MVSQEPVDLVEQAQRDLAAIDRTAPNSSGFRWDDGAAAGAGRPRHTSDPALERLRDAYPPGLVQLRSFLGPAPND